ncbi:uncharacterized protein [Dermacentor albipictus]|uniref:uncharacterized protein n=1 Tax=Dermacentor albipictus TaxID=60249 RepID=UPI0038FD2513
MAEESSDECTPIDLSMKAEATPSTSRDGTQGASCPSGYYTTVWDNALRYQRNTQHTPMRDETCNVDGVTDNGSTICQTLWSIRSIDNAMPGTSRSGMEEASGHFEDGATSLKALKDLDKLPHHQNNAFSIDIEDLFCSVPHQGLLAAVRDKIQSTGEVRFENPAGECSWNRRKGTARVMLCLWKCFEQMG